jgi:hypothetical protein
MDPEPHKRGPCVGKYQHLIPLFNTTFRLPLDDSRTSNCHLTPSPTWNQWGLLEREILYAGVIPTKTSVMSSVMKMDVEPILRLADPEIWDDVLLDAEYAFEVYFGSKAAPPNFNPEFTQTSSAAFPFPQMGWRYKSDVLSTEWFEEEYVWNPFDKVCWWRYVPKHEYLSLFDIDVSKKIRTFLPSPLHLLYWQKVFFGPQDENLKVHQPLGIRYGIDFHRGGFDTMIRNHYIFHELDPIDDLLELLFWEGDVSGWDRKLPIMKQIYDVRTAHSDACGFEKTRDWVINETINSKLLLPNGDVVQKIGASNNSGSGTTTGDNCIGHKLISDYLDRCFAKLVKENPKAHKDLYGDDILKSLLAKYFPFLKDGTFICDTYEEFNLTIKKSAFKVQLGPVGMTFLGAKVVLVDKKFFVPAYNSDRIYVALVSNIDNPGKSVDVEAMKAYSLMALAWNDVELFDGIRDYILNLIKHGSGPFLDSVRETGLPTRNEIIYRFWLNCECSVPSLSWLEDGRILKEAIEMISSLSSFKTNSNLNEYEQNKESYAWDEGTIFGEE